MAWEEQKGLNIWTPKSKGDELVGEVVKVDKEATYGIQFTVKTDKGEEILTPSHKYLQNRMKDAEVGTKVKIVYDGQQPAQVKGNSPTEIYKVFFDKKK